MKPKLLSYLDRLVEDSNVVTKLEGHPEQNDETQPYQIERQVLDKQPSIQCKIVHTLLMSYHKCFL